MTTYRNTSLVRGRETINGSMVTCTFDSMQDLAEQALRPGRRFASSRATGRSSEWDLSLGFDGAVECARSGWAEGLNKVQHMVDDIEFEESHLPLPVLSLHVMGSRPDVGAYLSGSPRHFHRVDYDDAPRPVVHLRVSMAASYHYDANKALNRGAALVAAIDDLELRGERVEVDVIGSVTMYGTRLDVEVKVKRAEDPLQLDALVYGVAHAAVFRRLMFAIMEQYSGEYHEAILMRGYGMPDSAPDVADAITIPMTQRTWGWDTPTSALLQLQRMIPQLKITEDT